jgi:hypothetical protein
MRMKILKQYYGFSKPATVKQIADHMKEVPANIHYHVKKLVEIAVLELDHTEVVNGIVAKYYLPTAQTIKIEDDESSLKPGSISEYDVLISNFFDENKKSFLDQTTKDSSKSKELALISKTLYLSDKEYDDFVDYFKEISTKYKDPKEGKKPCIFFGGLVDIK